MTATSQAAKLKLADQNAAPVDVANVSLRGADIIADDLAGLPGESVELVVRHEQDELTVEGQITEITPTGFLIAFKRLSPRVLGWVAQRIDEQKRGRRV